VVATNAEPPAKALRVTVSWTDRAGQPQQVMLSSGVAAAAPALSGTLGVRTPKAAGGPTRRPMGRHPTIPAQARDFGDGRSAFVPPFRPWLVLVFNNVTGLITGICDFGFENTSFTNDNITPTDVASCDNNTLAQLLSGFVRFWRDSSGPDLTAANAEDPPGPALRLRMELTLTSSEHPSGSFCIDDANYDTTFSGLLPLASYFCIIKSNPSGLWSGRTEITTACADTPPPRATRRACPTPPIRATTSTSTATSPTRTSSSYRPSRIAPPTWRPTRRPATSSTATRCCTNRCRRPDGA
jgi:hypothetical protein